jgi:hypothetical protein
VGSRKQVLAAADGMSQSRKWDDVAFLKKGIVN